MIQDRLTAKFLNAKPTPRANVKPQPTTKAKTVKGPIADTYTCGRRLVGTFWL